MSSKPIIFSLDPNSGTYFRDSDEYYIKGHSGYYQGRYKYTPVFPNYTIDAKRFDYWHQQTQITFYSMVPIKRLCRSYLVEHVVNVVIERNVKDGISAAINAFMEQCKYNQKHLKMKELNFKTFSLWINNY